MTTPQNIRKRCAIVGTFSTWKECPFSDPTLYIASLNDAYTLGFPRADEWFEIHPLNKMWFRPANQKVVDGRQVPQGYYIRPEGHLEWLKTVAQTIPVWLQDDPPASWPENAKRLPVEALEAKYGTYWTSGPSYMLMSLYDRGFREFHIYGIHLATQHEYVEQRPGWESLLGRLLGPEVKETTTDKVRVYDGSNGVRVVLPVSCPILKHGWRYAYEPKPQSKPDPDAEEMAIVKQEKDALIRALVHWPKGKDRSKAMARLQRLEIIELDIQTQRAQRSVSGTLTAQFMQVA